MSSGFRSVSESVTSRRSISRATRNHSKSSGRCNPSDSGVSRAGSAISMPLDYRAEVADPAGCAVLDDLMHRPEAVDDVLTKTRWTLSDVRVADRAHHRPVKPWQLILA